MKKVTCGLLTFLICSLSTGILASAALANDYDGFYQIIPETLLIHKNKGDYLLGNLGSYICPKNLYILAVKIPGKGTLVGSSIVDEDVFGVTRNPQHDIENSIHAMPLSDMAAGGGILGMDFKDTDIQGSLSDVGGSVEVKYFRNQVRNEFVFNKKSREVQVHVTGTIHSEIDLSGEFDVECSYNFKAER